MALGMLGTRGPVPWRALVSPGWWHWGHWCPLAGGTGDTRSPATGGSGVPWLVALGTLATHGSTPWWGLVSPGWWHWGHTVPCHGGLWCHLAGDVGDTWSPATGCSSVPWLVALGMLGTRGPVPWRALMSLAGGTGDAWSSDMGASSVPWLVAMGILGTRGPLPWGALVSLAGGTGDVGDTWSPAMGGSSVPWLVALGSLGTHSPPPWEVLVSLAGGSGDAGDRDGPKGQVLVPWLGHTGGSQHLLSEQHPPPT